MQLKKEQKNIISEFCLDLSKGLALGLFATQGFVSETEFSAKLFSGLLHLIATLLFLGLAIVYKQDAR